MALRSGPIQGVFAIAATDPDPASVTVASGLVLYTLSRSTSGPPHSAFSTAAYMLVQMTDDTHVRAEMFTAPTIPADFTNAARVFSR